MAGAPVATRPGHDVSLHVDLDAGVPGGRPVGDPQGCGRARERPQCDRCARGCGGDPEPRLRPRLRSRRRQDRGCVDRVSGRPWRVFHSDSSAPRSRGAGRCRAERDRFRGGHIRIHERRADGEGEGDDPLRAGSPLPRRHLQCGYIRWIHGHPVQGAGPRDRCEPREGCNLPRYPRRWWRDGDDGRHPCGIEAVGQAGSRSHRLLSDRWVCRQRSRDSRRDSKASECARVLARSGRRDEPFSSRPDGGRGSGRCGLSWKRRRSGHRRPNVLRSHSNPLLTDVSVDWAGLDVSETYPSRLPDVFSAKPVVVTGRYGTAGSAVVRLKGMADGRELSCNPCCPSGGGGRKRCDCNDLGASKGRRSSCVRTMRG